MLPDHPGVEGEATTLAGQRMASRTVFTGRCRDLPNLAKAGQYYVEKVFTPLVNREHVCRDAAAVSAYERIAATTTPPRLTVAPDTRIPGGPLTGPYHDSRAEQILAEIEAIKALSKETETALATAERA